MKQLIFATQNNHKAMEIGLMLQGLYEVQSLNDLGYTKDIPETGATLQDNASIKARFVHFAFACNCFADDTGLEVEALDGAPGVYSARYAGEHKSSADNIQRLLAELQGRDNRRARFRTVISLVLDSREHFFEGAVEGHITLEPAGTGGFGYDPVFIPDGHDKTFAQLTTEVKNSISHRGIAIRKMCDFLRGL